MTQAFIPGPVWNMGAGKGHWKSETLSLMSEGKPSWPQGGLQSSGQIEFWVRDVIPRARSLRAHFGPDCPPSFPQATPFPGPLLPSSMHGVPLQILKTGQREQNCVCNISLSSPFHFLASLPMSSLSDSSWFPGWMIVTLKDPVPSRQRRFSHLPSL